MPRGGLMFTLAVISHSSFLSGPPSSVITPPDRSASRVSRSDGAAVSSWIRFIASLRRAAASRAMRVSPSRSTWGTRRSSASTSSRSVCTTSRSAIGPRIHIKVLRNATSQRVIGGTDRDRSGDRRSQSRKTTLRRELLIFKPPLYSMNPSFRNLFMKKFTRERVVPTISASVSCDTLGSVR
jgi:hypothetical protein